MWESHVLKPWSMSACTHAQRMHVHINVFKAAKDIAAGQELFIRYGSSNWFQGRNLSYADFDYESTMWRPDLHPLPIRRKVDQRIGADGRHSYAVHEAIRPGAILDISLCVEVSLTVVDQFPYLWDFVLTGETDDDCIGCQQTSASCALTLPVFLQMKAKETSENMLNGFCIFYFFTRSLPIPKPVII